MRIRFPGVAASLVLACVAMPLCAAAATDVVHVNLDPLIDAGARSADQFAVQVRHAASISAQGSWSQHGNSRSWVYQVRIPSAVSLSFHAVGVALPPSAVLTVSTPRATVRYVARDVSRSGLWGRPLPGDTLNFSLSVNASEADRVRFQIESLQAGYRSLGPGVPDHPHYLALKKAGAAAASGCTVNYSCEMSSANQGPSQATVALIIGNLYQCTGTLLNDTSSDATPYVLTARHCESGQLGGGDPAAAATVTAYWDLITPCGSPLGSIYDGASIAQSGATTVLEQQDLWLIRLDAPPAATDAFFAGWDATGAPISGGYSIHYALGEDQQYVGWNGTDILEQIPGATLGVAYDSSFWGVVNGVGNIGAGGSGAALFSPGGAVLGSASLALLTGGENTGGACPASPPPNPSPSTVTALFTSLSGAWTSTTDRTSSTGSTTLKSLLDPGNTGQSMLAGIATQPITLTASFPSPNTGDYITLAWNAPGATSCSASGGSPGDGWAPAQPASGSLQITNEVGGPTVYTLDCRIGPQLGAASVTVDWNYITPVINLSGGSTGPLTLGTSVGLNWFANVQPCVASGGLAGDGWAGPQPASGSFDATATAVGLTAYTLSCGTAPRAATQSVYVYGVEPYVTLESSVSRITTGTNFLLSWFGYGAGAPCVASGGSSNDGWAQDSAGLGQNGSRNLNESAPGNYTFTITCSGGGQTASSSQTVAVTSDPPAFSLVAAAPQQPVFQPGPTGVSTAPAFALLWSANAGNCLINYTNNAGELQTVVLYGEGVNGAVADYENTAGVVTYTLDCGVGSASATIDWVASAPAPVLSSAASTWAANVPYPLSWNSSAGPCVGSGGGLADGWAGSKSQTGTQSVSESNPGAYLFTLTCGSGAAATISNVIVQVPLPYIQIYSSPGTSPVTGLPMTTLTWSSSVGPCTYVDGTASNPAGVAVAPTGSAVPSAAVAGTYLFSLTCGSGAGTLYAATLAAVPVNVPTTLTASAVSVPVDAPVTLTWNSDNGMCYASGGNGNAPWSGTLGSYGSLVVTSADVASLVYGITCNSETAAVTVDYVAVSATAANPPPPSVTLTSSAGTETAGQGVTLSWSSQNADSCAASGGNSGDGWTGSLPSSGTMHVTESGPGAVSYSITCTGAPPAATATTSVVVVAAPSASHGGGALDALLLALLGTLVSGAGRGIPVPWSTGTREAARS